MKKLIFALFFAFAFTTFCTAQQIEMKKVFGGTQYIQHGHKMTFGELVKVMEGNLEAQSLIKKAKANNVTATILGGVGGFFIGYPIGRAIGGGEPYWSLVGVGLGFVGLSVAISASANSKAKNAVGLYNAALSDSSYHKHRKEFNILVNGNGIGLSMTF